MAPLAEIAAPLIAPMLQPILQDVGQAVGGAASGLIGGLGKDLEGILGQLMKSFNPLGGLLGGFQNQGQCPTSPFPFSPGQFPINNYLPQLPEFGGNSLNGNDWANMAANASGGNSWQTLNDNLMAAEKSGDPAKIGAATAQLSQYTNFCEAMSNAEKKKDDTMAAIIGNLR
jgi:hypothetical protein